MPAFMPVSRDSGVMVAGLRARGAAPVMESDHTVTCRDRGTGGVDAGRSRRLGGLGLRPSNRGRSRGEPDAYDNDPGELQ